VTSIDWFWAIVCNALVIGGAVVPALLFGVWFLSPPRGQPASRRR
jgi:hypothetical protein